MTPGHSVLLKKCIVWPQGANTQYMHVYNATLRVRYSLRLVEQAMERLEKPEEQGLSCKTGSSTYNGELHPLNLTNMIA